MEMMQNSAEYKRKADDEDPYDSSKRTGKFFSEMPDQSTSENPVTKLLDCEPGIVGRIIGRGGENIRYLQQASSCHIQVDQNFPQGVPRKIILSGTPAQVALAEKLVIDVIENGPPDIGPPPGESWVTQIVDCPQTVIGRVIGRGGETIRDLQAKSGAKIQVDPQVQDGQPRKVVISGTPGAVAAGAALVNQVMEGQQVTGPAGPNVQYIECPKSMVGRIIGRGGEVIRQLQQMSGARVQIDQNVPEGYPCKVTISGNDVGAVHYAMSLVQDVMNNGPQYLTTLAGGQGTAPGATGSYGQSAYSQAGYNQSTYGTYPPTSYSQPAYGQSGYNQQSSAYNGYQAPASAPTAAPAYGQYDYSQSGYSQAGYAQTAASAQGGYDYSQYSQPADESYAAAPAPAASEWSEHKMPDGTPYWYNSTTGVSQWEKPAGMP